MPETKPTNPKDAVGGGKLPLELIPWSANAETSLAFLEGALKYGRFNWRVAGVRASVYLAAMCRHLAKWWNGSDRDPKTRVKHLANARACIDILIDAEWSGMLTDDRPPRQPEIEARIDELADVVAHLKELFRDCHPHQYTIEDSCHEGTSGRGAMDDPLAADTGVADLLDPRLGDPAEKE